MKRVTDRVDGVMEQEVGKFERAIESLPQWLARKLQPMSPLLASWVGCVVIDSPLVLTFAGVCAVIHAVNSTMVPKLSQEFFACWPLSMSSLRSPMLYWRLVSHIFGHISWEHLNGNMINLLLVGPPCERAFGTFQLSKIIFLVAVASGLAHMLLGPSNGLQLGASGVVFALILLNSLLSVQANTVPLTFICQACLWCWKEVFGQLLGGGDGVSHIAHLSGAVMGTLAGYHIHGTRRQRKAKTIAQSWFRGIKTKFS